MFYILLQIIFFKLFYLTFTFIISSVTSGHITFIHSFILNITYIIIIFKSRIIKLKNIMRKRYLFYLFII